MPKSSRGRRSSALHAALHCRPGVRRRLLPASLAGLSVAAALLIAPTLASADSSSTLTVVGTSDVSDSGLMPNLIMPEFESAFPQFTFKYIGTATGTAITDAETGAGGPSVLIVHAASLENQFVAGGYSYEPYGRAIFTNDFVLAGPSADPAGVAANGAHDIVQAYADVAAAGNAGKAEFVSRGGTPGTTVAEHQIWALVGAQPTQPAGLLLCTVSTANGGGETPIASGGSVTADGQACPATVPLPSWYAATGLTQGPNVQNANACSFPSGANTCYVFTDRGTYDYLSSGTDPAGSVPNLTILTRQNSASAPGGANELINYFHAYIINPAKFADQPNVSLNLAGAQDFVNFLTAPAFQSQLKNYLGGTNDPPFVADASPGLTASAIPGLVNAGTTVTLNGSLTNPEPGFPVLANQPVSISELEGGLPVPVASGNTDASGNYSIGFVPTSTGSYQVSTGLITQIELTSLSPPFGDLLQPAATAAASLSVQGGVSITATAPTTGGIVVAGTVAPGGAHASASVAISARPQGSSAAFRQVASAALAATAGSYAIAAPLAPGAWQVEASFADPGRVLPATSSAVNVTVTKAATTAPRGSSTVAFKTLKVVKGALTATGTVSVAPTGKTSYVELFGRHGTALKTTKKANTSAVSFPRIAKVTVAKDKKTFTIHARLKRGYRWVLKLEYVRPGPKTSVSKLKSIIVR